MFNWIKFDPKSERNQPRLNEQVVCRIKFPSGKITYEVLMRKEADDAYWFTDDGYEASYMVQVTHFCYISGPRIYKLTKKKLNLDDCDCDCHMFVGGGPNQPPFCSSCHEAHV